MFGAAGPEYEWVVPMSGVASRMGPQHVALLHLAAVLSGVAMAGSGKGYYAMAASSWAGGDLDPGWDAASSLQQVAQSRAWQWRTAEGLDRDEDFAYAFTDFDHAVGIAGHHVADACPPSPQLGGVSAGSR